jgi:hypothetical protein
MNTTTKFGSSRRQRCGCIAGYGLWTGCTGSWKVTLPCARHRNEVNQQDYSSRGWYAPYDDQRILVRELHAWHTGRIEPAHGGRSWTITDGENEIADSGWAADEAGAKAAVADWAEADWAEADLLVAQITDDLLSAAFTAHGHASATVDRLERAVRSTTQIAS